MLINDKVLINLTFFQVLHADIDTWMQQHRERGPQHVVCKRHKRGCSASTSLERSREDRLVFGKKQVSAEELFLLSEFRDRNLFNFMILTFNCFALNFTVKFWVLFLLFLQNLNACFFVVSFKTSTMFLLQNCQSGRSASIWQDGHSSGLSRTSGVYQVQTL